MQYKMYDITSKQTITGTCKAQLKHTKNYCTFSFTISTQNEHQHQTKRRENEPFGNFCKKRKKKYPGRY